MIRHLFLCNFKSFKSLDITLSNLTLLTGINGAGKSSIIQSLLLLRQSYKDKETILSENVRINGDLVDLYDTPAIRYINSEETEVKIAIGNAPEQSIIATISTEKSGEIAPCKIEGDLEKAKEWCGLFNEDFVYLYADRAIPARTYSRTSSRTNSRLGDKHGSNSAFFLAHVMNNNQSLAYPELQLLDRGDVHLNLSAWMSYIMGGSFVKVTAREESTNDASLLYEVQVNGTNQKLVTSPLNLAFGYSYIFPIVLAVLTATEGSLILIENPEAHLHPSAQTRMGEFLSKAAQCGIQIVAESHSDHLMNGVRLAVKNIQIDPSNVEFYYINSEIDQSDDPRVNRIIVEENGTISRWPNGFFDEWGKTLMYLMSE